MAAIGAFAPKTRPSPFGQLLPKPVVNYVPEKLLEAGQTARLTIEIMISCNRRRICADQTRIIVLPIVFDFLQ
jgi:hypothetical protein